MSKPKAKFLLNKNARNVAVNCLLAFEHQGLRLQDCLENIFQNHPLSDSDKRLAYEIAAGSCRHLLTLDQLINIYSSRGFRKIEPVLKTILRIALYQMLFLEKTPDFAVLDEAVKQIRATGLTGAASFVNAILRSVQRDIKEMSDIEEPAHPQRFLWRDGQSGIEFNRDVFPDPHKHPAKYLSLGYSHPLWLMERWLKQYDFSSVRRLCLASNQRPSLTLRINTLQCTAQAYKTRLSEASVSFRQLEKDDTLVQITRPASPEKLPGFEEGAFSVQDATAALAAPLLDPLPGQRILDLCAAPGGKTTHLAELMRNDGVITACDIQPEKLERITANAARLGIDIIRTLLADDLETDTEKQGLYDAVLVDAPCSNTGVMSRRVEVRHLLKPVTIKELSKLQLELLEKAAQTLMPSGKILYSTCSIDTLENEMVVKRFLEKHPEFETVEQKFTLPSHPAVTPGGQAGAMSHDGGFLALLARP